MIYMTFAYVVTLILYLCVNIYFAKKFLLQTKKYNTHILMDRLYFFSLILTFFLYYAMLFEDFFTFILNPNLYDELPFTFRFVPLIATSCNIFIREGLISYNENHLIGYNCIYDMKNIKVRKVKFSKFDRVKIVLSVEIIKNKNKTKKNLAIRTSNEKYKQLEKTLKLKMCY